MAQFGSGMRFADRESAIMESALRAQAARITVIDDADADEKAEIERLADGVRYARERDRVELTRREETDFGDESYRRDLLGFADIPDNW